MYIRKAKKVDVLLICEGTFPYIKGGVSSWIYQLIKGLNDLSFGIVFLGGNKNDYTDLKYDLPENLTHLETHFLFDNLNSKEKATRIEGNKNLVSKMRDLHYWFRSNSNLSDELKKLSFYKEIDYKQFLYSKKSFVFTKEEYEKNCPDVSFTEYFWTIRNIHSPIWIIANIAMNLPDFNIVHSPSTGYAGFLASFLKYNYNKKFILTEHGIYLMERKIDIMISTWINDYKLNLFKNSNEKNYIRELWINFFKGINKFSYDSADKIISLYTGAQKMQISLGASQSKTEIIPNGVDIENLSKLRVLRPKETPKVISLIGRVVPIKDIKTFITSIKIVSNEIADIQGLIIGPTDEDKEYFEECKELVKTLNLENNIKFMGFQKIEDILLKTGILTLTSISEGMPLVVLEAFAAGVIAVATDVGSCSELIYGKNEEDIKIGKAGEIVSVSNPSKLAENYISLLKDKDLYLKYQENAIKRVETYYDEKKLLKEYRDLYLNLFKKD